MELTPWIKLSDQDNDVVTEIEKEKARGCVLIAGALVEQRLEQTIKLRLRDDGEIAKRLFRGMGGLGTFSAKIHLGYLLQLYSLEVHSLLDKIRNIRNDFALETAPINFDTPAIAEKCFILAALCPAAFIDGHGFIQQIASHTRGRAGRLIATPDGHFGFAISVDPRASFITAAKLSLFLLALAKEAYENDRIPTPKPRTSSEKSKLPPPRAARAPNPHRKMRKVRRKSPPK